MKRTFNTIPSPKDTRDWRYTAASRSLAPQATLPPPTLDLRPNMQPVRDQGKEGACTAFASAAMREYQERSVYNAYFSPEFIFWNRADQTVQAMFVRDAMDILKNKGICPEVDCPFGKITSSAQANTVTATTDAAQHKITGYALVSSIDELKVALVNDGPCIIVFPVYNFDSSFWTNKTGATDPIGYHSVCVCGYDATGFIIRNSWGNKWANNGYTTYPYTEWGKHNEVWSTVSATPLPKNNNNTVNHCCVIT